MPPHSPLANSAGRAPTTPAIKPPSERLRETLRRYHYSLRTEESYLMWCRQFVAFHGGCSPMQHIDDSSLVGVEAGGEFLFEGSEFAGETAGVGERGAHGDEGADHEHTHLWFFAVFSG